MHAGANILYQLRFAFLAVWRSDRCEVVIETTLWFGGGRQGKVLVSWTGLLFLGGARQPFRWKIQSLQPLVIPLLIYYLQLHRRSVVRRSNELVFVAVTTWVCVAETMMRNAVARSRVVSCELRTLFLASAPFFVLSSFPLASISAVRTLNSENLVFCFFAKFFCADSSEFF